MKNKVISILVAAALLMGMTSMASAETMHLVALSQDADAEVEVTADGRTGMERLDKGFNLLTYEVKEPKAEVLAYGDRIPLRVVKDKSGCMWCMVTIAPPVDGDGEVMK